jgi:NAD(P)H-dependent nitrite reductase small subunit
MGRFVKVAKRSEIPDGGAKAVDVGERRIAIFRIGETFYAIADSCLHEGGPLSEGAIEGEEVECPWHASRFSLRTGEALSPPATENVACYEVRVTGEDVEVEI